MLHYCSLQVYRVVGPDAYFIGIIDFQQKWTIQKRVRGMPLCCICCCAGPRVCLSLRSHVC